MLRACAAAALLVLAGCGDDDAEPRAEPPAETRPPDPTPAQPDRDHPEPEVTVRLEAEGEVRVNGSAPAPDVALRPGDRVETSEGARAVLSLPAVGRITLAAGTSARLDAVAPFAVAVGRGRARGVLPPAGGSNRPPLRLAGPGASLELGGSGDAVLAVSPDGATWVGVLSGLAEVDRGEAGEDGRILSLSLVAGQAATVDGALPEAPGRGPTREDGLDDAVGAALGTRRGAASPAGLRDAAEALDALLDALDAESERGDSLADRQREAVGRSPEESRAIQREIVACSQRVLRLRRALRTRWERLVAWGELSRVTGRPPSPDPVEARAERGRAALGDGVP